MKKKKFELDASDVLVYWIGSRHGRRGSLSRASSAVDLRGASIKLVHAPTQLEVEGQLEMGHYSNKQIHGAQAALHAQLLGQLTDAVARHLRIPGR